MKSEYQKKRVWLFLLQNTVRIENVTLSRIALRYYRDSVTVILTAPSLQTYVMSRAVTEHCHAESPAGRVQCFKMAKIDPVSTFNPLFDWKKKLSNGKTSLHTVNIYFCAFRNWKCLHNYRRPTTKIPELRWCLTEMSFNNPSQFPGMF